MREGGSHVNRVTLWGAVGSFPCEDVTSLFEIDKVIGLGII